MKMPWALFPTAVRNIMARSNLGGKGLISVYNSWPIRKASQRGNELESCLEILSRLWSLQKTEL